LSETNQFVRLAAHGLSVWHLCYRTPPVSADNRPSRVTFYRYDSEMCTLVDLAEASAPSAANPWTANVMVALPPVQGFVPFFNLANGRGDGNEDNLVWAVQENQAGSDRLELNGTLQIWRVNADGSQTPVQPDYLCYDPTSGTLAGRASFLIPETVSPEDGGVPQAGCGLTAYACSLVPR
jgi:hypothetical protein